MSLKNAVIAEIRANNLRIYVDTLSLNMYRQVHMLEILEELEELYLRGNLSELHIILCRLLEETDLDELKVCKISGLNEYDLEQVTFYGQQLSPVSQLVIYKKLRSYLSRRVLSD